MSILTRITKIIRNFPLHELLTHVLINVSVSFLIPLPPLLWHHTALNRFAHKLRPLIGIN